ncbi:APC family permease [Motilibacter deserti]|uniref:APC family permease n=1 Tax=Motilibacter deserti TaxID=2714956 RepID=A0ABX0GWY8_9ACTN|nr:APC family permease [Motilibacter deserti]NHC14206.1 APC family permease [Motilibacter deserti]
MHDDQSVPAQQSQPSPAPDGVLRRELNLRDAVLVGLGAMLGAGVFAAFAPAARAAGAGLLLALAAAAVVAYCNATSSAALAAAHPQAGGSYLYGRRQLGPLWGFLAGWGFVIGKTASCAAMALTAGAYAWPDHPRPVAVVAAAALTAVNYLGVTRTAALNRLLVAVTLAVLGFVVVTCLAGDRGAVSSLTDATSLDAYGVLQAAGLLFFAFAGYARLATLGEEVRDPERTIPRAVPLALGIVVAVYALVAVGLLLVLSPAGLAASTAPLRDAVAATGHEDWAVLVRVGAVTASLGVLLSAMAGVGRTTLAMARDRELPVALAAVHPRFGVPHRAELTLGAVVVVIVSVSDVRGAIGFSSLGVLVYYAVANASAWTLRTRSAVRRPVAALGLVGCVVLAAALPFTSVVSGIGVLACGLLLRAVVRARRADAGPRRGRG